MAYPSNDGPEMDEDLTGENEAKSDSHEVAAGELRSFIERLERLNSDKQDIAEDIKEVYAEAKGQGYDVKVMRKLIAERKRNKDEVSEEEAVLEMYRAALGDV